MTKELAVTDKSKPRELFNRSPLGASVIHTTDGSVTLNPQDKVTDIGAANNPHYQIENHSLFYNSFASARPITVQETGQSMITVEESDESKLNLKKGIDQYECEEIAQKNDKKMVSERFDQEFFSD